MMLEQSQVVMAVFAHPDDAELTCFGTLAKLAQQGSQVYVLNMTTGESSTTARPGMREREARASVANIQAQLIQEHLPDGKLSYDNQMVSLIEQHIRRVSPDVVITHYPQDLGQGHQDHFAVSCAAVNAGRRSSSVKWLLYAEPQLQNSDFIPNFYIDITDFIELKKQSLAMYQSESGKSFMHHEIIENRGRWWAYQASVQEFNRGRYYEAFSVLKGVMTQDFVNEGPRQLWQTLVPSPPPSETEEEENSFFKPYNYKEGL